MKFLPRTDCGWQNLEREANNRCEYPRSLASNADCIARADPPQTSGTRAVLSPLATLSLQSTSGVLPDPLTHIRSVVWFLLSRTRTLFRGTRLALRGAFLLELLINAVQQFLSFAIFMTPGKVRAGFHGVSLPDELSERKGVELLPG
jgi:hypothetical protein